MEWNSEYDVTTKGFEGWSMRPTSGAIRTNLAIGSANLNAMIFSCAGTLMIGGFDHCGTRCELYKSYSDLPGHNFVHLEIEIYWLDSWDNEWLYVYADEVPVLAQRKGWRYPAASSSLATVQHICGSTRFPDDYGLLEISFYHNQTTLDLKITSSLDQVPSDESWGIRSIKVTAGHQGNSHVILADGHREPC